MLVAERQVLTSLNQGVGAAILFVYCVITMYHVTIGVCSDYCNEALSTASFQIPRLTNR